jgi:alpha-galactosidase
LDGSDVRDGTTGPDRAEVAFTWGHPAIETKFATAAYGTPRLVRRQPPTERRG